MYSFRRALRLSLIPLTLASLPVIALADPAPPATPVGAAASPVAVDRSPWLYKGSDIPQDKDWHFGTLPNGLRYAVRHNGVPPGQVTVRVRVDAGSLMEQDSQRGYAHLIEHLTFRGSRYVPDGEARRVWQRMGATFGSDSNAQTTFTQTVYALDLPSATEPNLDESLKILSGMMEAPSFTQAALDSERPAVLAEQREQPGPQVRVSDKLRQVFFAGQPLADRSPIGNIATLEAATPASVKAFHDKWYRPGRTTVIVVGDMDPAVLERLVIKNFADWKGIGPAPADPDFGTPDPKAPVTGAISEPSLPPIIQMGVVRPWHFNADTVLFNQKRMVDQLALQIINRRLETRARAGGSYISAQVGLDDISRSANATTVSILPIGDNWQDALKDVRAVIADAQTTPPSQAEIDRELAEYDNALKTQVATEEADSAVSKAQDMVQALDIRETTTSAKAAYDIFQQARAKHMFTPAAMLASTKRVFQGVTRAIVNTRTPDDKAAGTLATDLTADVRGLAGKRTALAAASFAKLPKLGTPATVVSDTKVNELDVQNIAFSNGVKMLLYPNSAEANRVYVVVRFGRGYRGLPADRPTPEWSGDLALVASGIGSLGQEEIDALTSGRRLGMQLSTGDDAFALVSVTSPEDLEDQLRLMATKLQTPGWDPNPVARAKAVTLAGYPGFDASPDGVLARDLEGLLHAGDPRWTTPSPDQVRGLTPQRFKAFWQPILASGPIEVDIFGDVKAPAAIAAVAKTIGALGARPAAPVDPAEVRFPAHDASPVVRHHTGPENQAAAVIAWPTGGGVDAIADSRKLEVLSAVFGDRLFDKLRTEAGASYSPSVDSQWPVGLPTGGRMIAIGKVPPDKVDFFFASARQIAADLAAQPLGEDELQRTLTPIKQRLLRASSGNTFWLRELMGGATDPRRIAATISLPSDYGSITAADIQAVAKKYLRPDKDWTMEVLPTAKPAPVPPTSR